MGNCLFDSLNTFIGLANSHALRLALVRFVGQNAERFKEDIIANGYPSVEHYVATMQRNGVDGDHLMIAAAAMMYNTKIEVQMPNQKVFTEQPLEINDSTKTCSINWVPGHYSVAKARRASPNGQVGLKNGSSPSIFATPLRNLPQLPHSAANSSILSRIGLQKGFPTPQMSSSSMQSNRMSFAQQQLVQKQQRDAAMKQGHLQTLQMQAQMRSKMLQQQREREQQLANTQKKEGGLTKQCQCRNCLARAR